MKIIADSNVLLRAIVRDDIRQSELAQKELSKATLIAVTIPALCELVWVMSAAYKIPQQQIADAVQSLANATNTVFDAPAVEAGLRFMELGGDFADGVIAFQGKWLGAETFVSFDKKAVSIVQADGESGRLLA